MFSKFGVWTLQDEKEEGGGSAELDAFGTEEVDERRQTALHNGKKDDSRGRGQPHYFVLGDVVSIRGLDVARREGRREAEEAIDSARTGEMKKDRLLCRKGTQVVSCSVIQSAEFSQILGLVSG